MRRELFQNTLAPNQHHLPLGPRKTPVNSPLLDRTDVLQQDLGKPTKPHKMGTSCMSTRIKTGPKGHFRGTDLHQICTTHRQALVIPLSADADAMLALAAQVALQGRLLVL